MNHLRRAALVVRILDLAMPSETCARLVAFLSASRNADGGWPYLPGRASAIEPTCYALLALGKSDRAVAGGTRWLVEHAPGKSLLGSVEPHWSKALALFALARLDGDSGARGRLQEELLRLKGRQTANPDFNAELVGWSWVEGTFSWVEPTSYALLALKAAGAGGNPRVAEGHRLLLDRICSDGGWNYGNPRALGAPVPSMTGPTAAATLALQGFAPGRTAVDRALDWLGREVDQRPSTLALGLAALSWLVYGRSGERWAPALEARVLPDGSCRRQVHLSAVALLALQASEGGPNAFRL